MESKREWYALVYRCQRCGFVDENPQTALNNFEAESLMDMLIRITMPSVEFRRSFTLDRRRYHKCADGYGVMEFVGLRNREAEEQAQLSAIEAMVAAAAKEAKTQ